MPTLLDVSLPISPRLPHWPGDPAIAVEPAKRMANGDAANVSRLDFGNHSGTHMDPPSHFVEGGKAIDELDPNAFVGAAMVVELADVKGEITREDLESAQIPPGTERVLLKTSNSGTLREGAEFNEGFVSVGLDAARWLIDRGVRLVGVDYLSVERFDAPFEHPVHRTLLGAEVVVVEGLDLSEAPAGPCELLCLPLRVAGGDGAPARAFLRLP